MQPTDRRPGTPQTRHGLSVSPHGVPATPSLLKDLRSLRVLLLHPEDNDGDLLRRQLQRIGCQVQAVWPPRPQLPEGVDVVFLAVRPDSIALDYSWACAEGAPPVIAVVTYENPTIVDAVLRVGAKGVVSSPVRSFGLLSSLVLARKIGQEIQAQARRIAKLETKLAGQKRIAEAKTILMQTRGIHEDGAYNLIRDQAMAKRVNMEEIATAIINANEILSFRPAGQEVKR